MHITRAFSAAIVESLENGKVTSTSSWKAILKYPASGNRPAGERVYLMERVK